MRWATLTGLFLGSVLTLVLLEVVLRMLPTRDGVFAANTDPDWPAHHLVPNAPYTFSDAWNFRLVRRGVTNNLGYVAPFDYLAGTRGIAVIGDSYIESMMNSYADTLQGQLAGHLDHPQPILNFGTSGAELPDYLGLASMITGRFNVTWVVVLINKGDFVGGFATKPGYFEWDDRRRPAVRLAPELHRGSAIQLTRQLALVRYVRGNLSASLRHLLSSSAIRRQAQCVSENLRPGDERLLREFANDLPQAYGVSPSHVILLFDADRDALYSTGGRPVAPEKCRTRDSIARDLLADTARSLGENVIDMKPVFAAYFNATGERVDYSPIDAHWNAAGHRLAAGEVSRVINAEEESAK